VRIHRIDNIDYVQAYDRKRGMLPHRVVARKEYLQTEAGKVAKRHTGDNYAANWPQKKIAHSALQNAVKRGEVIRQERCSKCASLEKIEAHHDDYNKPLEVRWLCEKCHKEWHRHNEPIV
jgi:ribosomal protein S27AE